jgi:hypothetical protein
MARQQQQDHSKPSWPLGRYRLKRPHYMPASPDAEHPLVLREGAEVSFAGRPSQAMEPLDANARKAVELREQELAREQAQAEGQSLDALLAGLSAEHRAALKARLGQG